MAPKTAPFGTWESPISTKKITEFVRFRDVIVDPVQAKVYHIESRPREDSRNVLVDTDSGKDMVGRKWNVRTAVQEFGGGAAIVYDGIAYFSNFDDNRVYRVKKGGEPEPITPDNKAHRYANFNVCPQHPHLLVAIMEKHTEHEPSKVETILCVINAEKKSVHQLTGGANFYSYPKFSPDGKHMAWQEWYFPDMPWQGSELHVAEVAKEGDSLSLKNGLKVAGERRKSAAVYPTWANNNTLVFSSDESGFQNPYMFNTQDKKCKPILQSPMHAEFAEPQWLLSYSPHAIIGEKGNMVVFSAFHNSRNVMLLLDLEGKSKPDVVESSYVSTGHFHTLTRHADKSEFVFIGGERNRKASITKCSLTQRNPKDKLMVDYDVLRTSTPGEPFTDYVSPPVPITMSSEELNLKNTKGNLHMILYQPLNPDYIGSSILNEKPPCVVNVHDGPTAVCKEEVEWTKQYFTSRGWVWIDVNYGGSSGFGRKYMDRLNGNWGKVDVEDCMQAARILARNPNLVPGIDENRLVIRGPSAGGFTALASLCLSSDKKFFAAATSIHGISDLKTMYDEAQKFESHYLDSLLGGSPHDKPDVYRDRSPLNHADKIERPVLFLQGRKDRIVPLKNTEKMVDEIKKRGGTAWLEIFDDEGHGWRSDETMKKALEKEFQFYTEVLKIKARP